MLLRQVLLLLVQLFHINGLDGTDLVDGVITSDVLGNATGIVTIVDESGSTTKVDFG